ncbi:hypothetical protein CY34DRAFT_803104, partial [Suillus luteus UH-Slu-Lm8-n1]
MFALPPSTTNDYIKEDEKHLMMKGAFKALSMNESVMDAYEYNNNSSELDAISTLIFDGDNIMITTQALALTGLVWAY